MIVGSLGSPLRVDMRLKRISTHNGEGLGTETNCGYVINTVVLYASLLSITDLESVKGNGA